MTKAITTILTLICLVACEQKKQNQTIAEQKQKIQEWEQKLEEAEAPG